MILVSLLVLGMGSILVAGSVINRAREHELLQKGRRIAQQLVLMHALERGAERGPAGNLLGSAANLLDARLWLVDPEGKVSGTWPAESRQADGRGRGSKDDFEDLLKESRIPLLVLQKARQGGGRVPLGPGVAPGLAPALRGDFLLVAVPMQGPAGNTVGALALLAPLRGEGTGAEPLRRLFVYTALAATAASVLLAYFLARGITRPLEQMRSTVMEMAGGHLSARLPINYRDELGSLAAAFNYLAGELQQNIAALDTERTRLGQVLESLGEGVVAVDGRGRVALINPRAVAMLGLEKLPEHGIDAGQARLPSNLAEILQRVSTSGHPEETGLEVPGGLYGGILTARVSPVRAREGQPNGAAAVLRDVTQQRRLEKLRRDFIGNVSHEFRAPLASLQGFLELMLDGTLQGAERERYIRIMWEDTQRLNRLVDDLLDLSRLEAGILDVERSQVPTCEVLEGALERFRPRAEEKGVTLKAQWQEGLPPMKGDRDRLDQVMVNLLDNALRHTPEGGSVELGARVVEEYRLEVWVADSGPGIPEAEINRVWERFYKVDKARTPGRQGGTGIGLAIVKEIITRHGGEVEARNLPGGGARFGFRIPISQ